MAPYPNRARGRASRRACLAAGAAAALAAGVVSGCGVIGAVSKVAHDVSANRSIINGFATKLSNSAKTFEATYMTTGSSPATVVYAVQPPRDLLFSEAQVTTASGGAGSFKVVLNSSGEYLCSVSPGSTGPPGQWSCQKLGPARAKVENQVLDFYTPVHWVNFLRGFALAAGFAGDKVSTSTKSINGLSMSCVDFRAPGIKGTSSICTAPQNILGYVKVAGDPNSFVLKSYSTSPAASLFQPPPGAKITTGNGSG